MKTIIIHYSFSGNNRLLADHLQQILNCDIERIVERRARKSITILLDLLFSRQPTIEQPEAKLEDYDMVILIAPVWDAKIATPMQSFIRKEKHNIRNYALITVCAGRKGQHQKLEKQLIELSQQEPIAITELKINDLLPAEHQNKIRYTTPYHVKETDLIVFKKEIRDFVSRVDPETRNLALPTPTQVLPKKSGANQVNF